MSSKRSMAEITYRDRTKPVFIEFECGSAGHRRDGSEWDFY